MSFLGFPGIHRPEHYRKFIDTPSTTDLAKLQSLLQQDPLNRNKYKPNEKDILIKCRSHYKSLPHGLQIFLTIIDWTDPEQVVQAHKMIRQWILLPPDEALPMLDARYPDEIVRLYAVERLTSFTDDELSLFMIQLTQALMFDTQHYSSLGEMLLERSLINPFVSSFL